MSSQASPRTGWWRPADLCVWRTADAAKRGLDGKARDLLGISLGDLTATLEAPWELTIKEKVKPGRDRTYGNRYFAPEQEIWLTDRGWAATDPESGNPTAFPNSATGSGNSVRLLFYGKIISAEFDQSGGIYNYRVADRRYLCRRIPVTFSGGHAADAHSSAGPNRIVFNPPPGDGDAGFDPLGGNRSDLFQIISKYFDIHKFALIAQANVQPVPALTDFIGWNPQETIPGKIALEDVNFEEGLIQILGVVPFVRFYVDPRTGTFKFISPLRLQTNHKIEVPVSEDVSRDYPISSSWELNTEEVYTAVRIVAKTGKIKNNWTRMISGFGSKSDTSTSGASDIPRTTPTQPGITVGIRVNSQDSVYYEDWAAVKTAGRDYFTFAGLPDGGGGTKRPIYMLAMWESNFEQDFRGDGLIWTGYRQTQILAGHYNGVTGQIPGQNLIMSTAPLASISPNFKNLTPTSGVFDFAGLDTWIYKLTDTSKFWRSAGYNEPTTNPVSPAVDRRRRRGPWAGAELVIPPQPGVTFPAPFVTQFGEFAPIRMIVQMTDGTDLYASIVPEQQAYVFNANFAGAGGNNKIWYYEVREPGNKLIGPFGQRYTTGGRWSSMFNNWRVFDPEMVWRFVNSSGATDQPRFAQFSPQVCFVGIFTKIFYALNPGFVGPVPDPPPAPDPGGAWKQQSSTVFFEIKARLGGDPLVDSAMISTGATRTFAVSSKQGAGTTEDKYYSVPFDLQFGWIVAGGALEVRQPSDPTVFQGDGFDNFGIKREKVFSVDLSEFQDVPEATQDTGFLGARLQEIAAKTLLTTSKVPRIGQITLFGLDFEHITYLSRPLLNDLQPFTYYITLDIDQQDVKPPPLGGTSPTIAATLQVRYDFEAAQTTIDLTEDRSGFQRDLIGELISDFKAKQLLKDLSNAFGGFKAFKDCIGAGNDPGDGGGNNAGSSGSDICGQKLPDPSNPGSFVGICQLLYRLNNKKGGGDPQPKNTIIHNPAIGGFTTAGGFTVVDADDDSNALTDRFDEFPFGGQPPIVEDDFIRRGAEFLFDAKNQKTVLEFYGQHNRYRWMGASLHEDGIRWQRDDDVIPCDGGRIHGFVTAFAMDFMGWSRELLLQLSEDETSYRGIYSVDEQPFTVDNGGMERWRLWMPDDVPADCVLYLDFEEASGSLHDLSTNRLTLAASGSPTYGATGLVSGERAITTVQGSSSFSVATITGHAPLYAPFAFYLRFKFNAGSISHTLVSNYSSSTGYKIEINSSDKLVVTIGDGTTTATVTASAAMVTGTWCSYFCFFDREALRLYQEGQLTVSSVSPGIVSIGNSAGTLTVGGSVTWDELALMIGGIYTIDDAGARCAPTGWKIVPAAGSSSAVISAISTSDKMTGNAAWSMPSVSLGTSPVFVYIDSDTIEDLSLIPGHSYRLNFALKKSNSPTVTVIIRNLDKNQDYSGTAFSDVDSILTYSVTTSWASYSTTFTVPTTHDADDRWRFGLSIASASGTVTLLIDSFSITEIDAGNTGTEYEQVDSDGVLVSELDDDGNVATL